MSKAFIGTCNWCLEEKELEATPVAGVRLCNDCLHQAGVLFMQTVAKLKHTEKFKPEDEVKTSNTVIKVLNYLHQLAIDLLKKKDT